MNRILRLLMMFGPMLYKAYQKYQRGNSQQQPTQNADGQIDNSQPADNQEYNDRG